MHQIPAAARIALILILLLRLVIAQWTCRGFRRRCSPLLHVSKPGSASVFKFDSARCTWHTLWSLGVLPAELSQRDWLVSDDNEMMQSFCAPWSWCGKESQRSQLSSCAMTSPSYVVCSMEVLELGAPQIHSAAEAPRRGPTQLATRQAAPQGRSCVQVVGCPGPKSRGIGARLVAEEGNFARSTQSDTAFTQPSCSYADVRVGSNSGRRLPGTTLDGTADTQRAVKPLDPFFFDACGQAIGVLVISYARHIVSRSQQVFVQGVLAHHMLFFFLRVSLV